MRKILFINLIFATLLNIIFFFYIKNNTYKMIVDNKKMNSTFIEEDKNLYFAKNELNKNYSIEKLKKISEEKLNLRFSNVKQLKDIDDVFGK